MRILVTGAFGPYEQLKSHFADVQFDYMRDERETPAHPEVYDGVICNALLSFHDAGAFEKLKFVQLTAAGYDRAPVRELKARGVRVYNAGHAYATPMAEAAVWGVLTLYRKGKVFIKSAQCHAWEKQRGLLELSGKRVCIVGCGNYGKAAASLFAAFGCTVVGVNRTGKPQEGFAQTFAFDQLHMAVADADILLCALPQTEQTVGVFNRALFASCKPSCVLVNLSRGGVCNQADMMHALQSGALGGAVLDVFEVEPLAADSPLWDMENVLITPHNSYAGDGVAQRLLGVVQGNLERELA